MAADLQTIKSRLAEMTARVEALLADRQAEDVAAATLPAPGTTAGTAPAAATAHPAATPPASDATPAETLPASQATPADKPPAAETGPARSETSSL
jgi:hypothetical protein